MFWARKRPRRRFGFSCATQAIGIAPEDQSKIFDRFFRAEQPEGSETGGHGLGLSLAKEIVEIHWGELQVSSTLGEGSEFTILLKKSPILLKEAV